MTLHMSADVFFFKIQLRSHNPAAPCLKDIYNTKIRVSASIVISVVILNEK